MKKVTKKKVVRKTKTSFEECLEVKIKDITLCRNHSRVAGGKEDEQMAALMRSIKQHGLLEPIGVKVAKKGKYEVVYGNRRFDACKKLGLTKIKAMLHKTDAKGVIVLNLVENIHRKSTNPYSRGRAYTELMKNEKMTNAEIAARCNVSASDVRLDINTFAMTPKDVAAKMTGSQGRNKNTNSIPENTVRSIVSQASRYTKVTKPKLQGILREIVTNKDVTEGHAKIILGLVDEGKTPKEAVKKASSFTVMRPTIVIANSEVRRLEKKYKLKLPRILAGMIKGTIKDRVMS